MPKTLFEFIWRYSSRQQIILLALTCASFPLLYLSLDLPRVIINSALEPSVWEDGSQGGPPTFLGFETSQLEYLVLLCLTFLMLVILGGVLKMYINIRKGVVAERLLRRFRFQMISRILRFPLPYFRRTSQGELISVVTSEAEPLGGIMGDAIAQPVFQAGQMLTILVFLFVQSPWLGLASVALIPLQAWLIPLLQRRVNALNKERVQNVRKLSERIGETVSGVEDLRSNNGAFYVLNDFSERLGKLFEIRRRIYETKFLMKFLNNFLNQLTPFFFFLVGGMLVMSGDLTIGALVAALASYKDLTSPWKELLAYHNQRSDMSVRYQIIAERLNPPGMLDERLFEGVPEETPRLDGDVVFDGVSVVDPDGVSVLRDISFHVPAGATVAIKVRDTDARRALAQLLARTALPSAGRVRVGERDIARLHQQAVAQRIGHAGGDNHLFNASVGDNVAMALIGPAAPADPSDPSLSDEERRAITEAILAGNRAEFLSGGAVDPARAGAQNLCELEAWWLKIIRAMGTDGLLFQANLRKTLDVASHPKLAARIVALREETDRRVAAVGASDAVDRFDPDRFNPSMTLIENLLFAVARPTRSAADAAERLVADSTLRAALNDGGVEMLIFRLAEDLLNVLVRTFEGVKGDHPLLVRVAGVDRAEFRRLRRLRDKLARPGLATLSAEETAAMLALPFKIAPRSLGLDFSDELINRVLAARRDHGARMRAALIDDFEPIEPGGFNGALSLIENALGGRLADTGSGKVEMASGVVAAVFEEAGLKGDIALLIGDAQAGVGGANIPPVGQERIAFSRAAIKRPDILVFERALPSLSPEGRYAARGRIRGLLPEATIFHLEEDFRRPEMFDVVLEIRDGRLVGADGADGAVRATDEAAALEAAQDPSAVGDMAAKARIVARTPLFAGLPKEQIQLIAYAARWVTADPGDVLFRAGERANGAYLVTKGSAVLLWPGEPGAPRRVVTEVKPGRIIGDLSVIADVDRPFDLIVETPLVALQIGRQELLEVIESDATVAASLLRTVGGYLNNAAVEISALRSGMGEDQVGDAAQPSAGAGASERSEIDASDRERAGPASAASTQAASTQAASTEASSTEAARSETASGRAPLGAS